MKKVLIIASAIFLWGLVFGLSSMTIEKKPEAKNVSEELIVE